MFVTASSTSQRLSDLRDIVIGVVTGAACGILANFAYPPLRYRGVQASIDALTASMAELLGDMRATLAQSLQEARKADEWLQRARGFDKPVAEIYQVINHAEESVRLNPRLRYGRHPRSFHGYRIVAATLSRFGGQLQSVARTFAYVQQAGRDEQGTAARTQRDFLSSYAELLDAAGEGVQDLGCVDALYNDGDVNSLSEHIRSGRERYHALTEQFGQERNGPGQWPLYGGLLVDGDRLIEELESARRQLSEAA